jgi:hypothetical protein
MHPPVVWGLRSSQEFPAFQQGNFSVLPCPVQLLLGVYYCHTFVTLLFPLLLSRYTVDMLLMHCRYTAVTMLIHCRCLRGR